VTREKNEYEGEIMEIIKLKPEQKKSASVVVAAAFYDYPQLTFYFPDPARRTRRTPSRSITSSSGASSGSRNE
jgi:hypothetical protein